MFERGWRPCGSIRAETVNRGDSDREGDDMDVSDDELQALYLWVSVEYV